MKVGDLVRVSHWKPGVTAILLSFRNGGGICLLAIGDYIFNQRTMDLEVINENEV